MPLKSTHKTTIELRGIYSDDSLSLEFDPGDVGVIDEPVADVVVTARVQDKRLTLEFRPDELDSLVRTLLDAGFGRDPKVDEDPHPCGGCAEFSCGCRAG